MRRVRHIDQSTLAEYDDVNMRIQRGGDSFVLSPTELRYLVGFASDVGMLKLDHGVEPPRPPSGAYLGPW